MALRRSIKCHFKFRSNSENPQSEYQCLVEGAQIHQKCKVRSFDGKHKNLNSNLDVDSLGFQRSKVFSIPRGLSEIFPHLTILDISECELREIKSENLSGLVYLQHLNVSKNSLQVLPDDLFVHTRGLKTILFSFNELQVMSSRIFDSIPDHQWEYVGFIMCGKIDLIHVDGFAGSSTLLEIKTVIDSAFGKPVEKAETTSNSEFKRLWELKDLSDFSIFVGEKEFQVHKVVLALQSPVLRSMLKNDVQVKATNKLELKDCSEGAAENFLRYLYTGEMAEEEYALDVFSLACIFDVPKIKIEQEKIAIKNLNGENVVKALKLGKIYESTTLIDAAFERMKSIAHASLQSIMSADLKENPERAEEIFNTIEELKASVSGKSSN